MVTQVKSSNIAIGAITSDQIASGAITVADIPDGEITAAKLHTTAVTDKLGYTPVAPGDSPSFAGLTIDTDTLYVDSTNNRVGIGTSNPSYNLDIVTSGTTASLQLKEDNDAGTTVFYNTINGSTGNNYIYFGDAADLNAGQIRYNHNADHMSFNTNATERLRIDSSGNVGIGTTTPDAVLRVQSDATGTDFRSLSTKAGLALNFNGTGISYYDSDTTVFRKSTSGSSTELMRIDSTGNLGIGTSSPSEKLDVNGNISIAGQGYSPTLTLTDGATIDWDTDNGQVATVTLAGNRTFNAPTNLVNGGFYALEIVQDGTGSRTAIWNSVFKFTGATAPTLTTTASAKDYLVFRSDGTNLYEQGRSLGVG